MTAPREETAPPETEWDELAPGAEISATVVMASGFVLRDDQRVRERYSIKRVLGEGGMGQVLAVTLLGSEDKQVYALKVVARAVTDETTSGAVEKSEAERTAKWFAELLRQEAAKQDVVQRHGVAVARLFALVQLDDGSIGMRMEIARGRSLESHVEEEKQRLAEPPEALWSVAVVRKLVSQLRRLHEIEAPGSRFGFVHSDIKPGNVFVDDSDPTDLHATLLDFGVATAGQALAADMSTTQRSRKTFVLQQTGGTIGYAPPHHFERKPTPLSDVHASLVILYELLTGEFPWSFRDIPVEAEHMHQLEVVILGGPRPVRELRPSIPIEDARILDDFFTREFKSLHALAGQVHSEMGDAEKDPPRELVETLRKLARDYQAKLDQIRNKLSPSRRAPADPQGVASMPVIPRAPLAPSIPGMESIVGAGETKPVEGSPRLLTRRKPKLIVMASAPPPPMNRAQVAPSPRKTPPTKPTSGRPRSPTTGTRPAPPSLERLIRLVTTNLWLAAAIAVPVVALIVLLVARALSR